MPIWDEARRKTFLAFGVEPPTVADYFRELENGDYLEVYRKRGITVLRDELNAIYKPAYEERLADATLFPGVVATLRQLYENGVRLVLVTSQQENLVVPLLNKFGIRHLFDDCAFHTFDKKAVVAESAQRHGAALDQCFFVGDSPSDIRHAKKAGIQAIAFLGNYIPRELLVGADHQVRAFDEIVNLVL